MTGGEPWDPADLAAPLAEDLSIFDAHAPGLAARLAAYVTDGIGAEVLDVVTTLEASPRQDEMLIVRHYRHPHMRGFDIHKDSAYDEGVAGRAGAARDAILFGPTPLPILRRYADILERVHAGYSMPGTSASPSWLRAFVDGVAEQGRFLKGPPPLGALTAARVLALIAPEERPIASLIDCCFDCRFDVEGSVALALPGLGAALTADLVAAWPSIMALPAKARALLFEAVGKEGDPAAAHLLFNGLADSAKRARDAAAHGLEALPAETVRGYGRTLLDVPEPMRRRLAQVVARIAAASEIGAGNPPDGPTGYTALDGSWVAAPPLPPDADTLPEGAAAAIAALDWVREGKTRHMAIGPDCPRRLVALMNGEIDPSKENRWLEHSVEKDAFLAICARPDISITCLTRLCLSGAYDYANNGEWFSLPGNLIRDMFMDRGAEAILARRFQDGGDMRHVLGATAKTGYSMADNVRRMLATRVRPPEDEPLDPTVWAAIATDFDALDEALRNPNTDVRWDGETHALVLLDNFPKTPARCRDLLVDRAIGGTPKVRAAARRRLEETGDVQRLIVPWLAVEDARVRAKAAHWLGARRDRAAVAPLRAALTAETSLDARAAMLAALVACGDDVADQFSEDTLVAEATAGLRKIKAEFSALFDRDRLPALRWADGRPVPAVVVRYWFALAHKLKRPGGDPLLHMALDRLDRDDAETLGETVLAAFIAADTRRPDLETANAHAEANAETYRRQNSWRRELTPAMAFAIVKGKMLKSYIGTAIGHRGLLALTRRTPIDQALAMATAFLREHSKRLPQAKALLEALAAHPDPRALRAVVAVARGHANLGLRKHASALVEDAAEAACWSALELGDRMLPTADLDARGGLDLPIGDKMFRAVLGDGPALALRDPDGRPAKTLPRATGAREKADGAAARKRLAAAGKAIDAAVATATDRFHQAMCAGRTWSADRFAAIVLQHPIASLVARRMVFVGFDANDVVRVSFRPLADGSLTDAADAVVDPSSFARVGIAHYSSLGVAAADAWRAHLADYDIVPPFDQLGRPLVEIGDPQQRHLADFKGRIVGARDLAAVAARLGYSRGRVGDPGSFNNFEKRLVDLGLTCDISMSDVPTKLADDVPITLGAASLRRTPTNKHENHHAKNVRLGRAPPILVSELWHDFKAIADAGPCRARDPGGEP